MAGKYATALVFLVICACNKCALSLSRSDFYSLVGGELVRNLPVGDDLMATISPLHPQFHFFGSSYSDLFVSTNGQISVNIPEENFIPRPFPTDKIIIAPFWADVDTRHGGGEIEYGVTSNVAELEKAQGQIAAAFPEVHFVPVYLVIATWDGVGYYNRSASSNNRSLLNTFQCVLATDGLHSFILFLYPTGGIQWTAGDTHGRNGIRRLQRFGRPPPAAIAGFNFNDSSANVSVKNFTLPNSGTDAIKELTQTSNVDITGLWIFRVDENEIGTPEPVTARPMTTITPEATTQQAPTTSTEMRITDTSSTETLSDITTPGLSSVLTTVITPTSIMGAIGTSPLADTSSTLATSLDATISTVQTTLILPTSTVGAITTSPLADTTSTALGITTSPFPATPMDTTVTSQFGAPARSPDVTTPGGPSTVLTTVIAPTSTMNAIATSPPADTTSTPAISPDVTTPGGPLTVLMTAITPTSTMDAIATSPMADTTSTPAISPDVTTPGGPSTVLTTVIKSTSMVTTSPPADRTSTPAISPDTTTPGGPSTVLTTFIAPTSTMVAITTSPPADTTSTPAISPDVTTPGGSSTVLTTLITPTSTMDAIGTSTMDDIATSETTSTPATSLDIIAISTVPSTIGAIATTPLADTISTPATSPDITTPGGVSTVPMAPIAPTSTTDVIATLTPRVSPGSAISEQTGDTVSPTAESAKGSDRDVGLLIGVILAVILAILALVIGCGAIIGYIIVARILWEKIEEEKNNPPNQKSTSSIANISGHSLSPSAPPGPSASDGANGDVALPEVAIVSATPTKSSVAGVASNSLYVNPHDAV